MRSKKKDRLRLLRDMFTGVSSLLKSDGSFLNFSCRKYVRHKMKGYDWEITTVEIPINTDRILQSVHRWKAEEYPDRCAYAYLCRKQGKPAALPASPVASAGELPAPHTPGGDGDKDAQVPGVATRV